MYTTCNTTAETDQMSKMVMTDKSKTDLCETIIGCHKYWRDTASGKIRFNSLIQSHGKMKYVPNFFISTFAPKTIGDWWKNFSGYVIKNHNGILKPVEAPESFSPQKERIDDE